MADSINPYQAPLVSSLESAIPSPGKLIPERLEFQGRITEQHYRDAIQHAGIRKDYRTSLRRQLVLGSVAFLGLLTIALRSNQNDRLFNLMLSGGILLVGFMALLIRHHYFVVRRIPAYQLIRGDIRGWIDQNGILVSAKDYQSYHPMDSLVSSAVDDSMLVLCFGREHFFFHVLPFDFFTDPDRTRVVASDLNHLYPPVKAILVDERKLDAPEGDLFFPAPEQSISYSGPMHLDELKGSRFYKASRRGGYLNLACVLFLLFCTLSSLGILFESFSLVVLGGLVWAMILIAMIWIRNLIRSRRQKRDGRHVLWNSIGWVGPNGFLSATAVGQSQGDWDFFDHYEITDSAIALYPHSFHGCAQLIGRDQFADDQQWQAACELVRSGSS